MVKRSLNPSNVNSFFLFGARGVGKSTYIREQFLKNQSYLEIDLLDLELEEKYAKHPKEFENDILAYSQKNPGSWIFVDEIQKIPKLLNYVHRLIEKEKIKFILTGSSARKLKRGSANMLAGRAFYNALFPLTPLEHQKEFLESLGLGSLPKLLDYKNIQDKHSYLNSYVRTYVKEEIKEEQIVRNLDPFRLFLEVSAQCSGKIINASKIARDVGVSYKSIQNYYQILEDTLLGFFLPSFHLSKRKSQTQHPKFYLFDNGVIRSLSDMLDTPLKKHTSYFGEMFEHYVIQNIYRHNSYSGSKYSLSYYATKNGGEIDLILSKGLKENIVIEIKSSSEASEKVCQKLQKRAEQIPNVSKKYLISRDSRELSFADVSCCPLDSFLKNMFVNSFAHQK